MPLIRKPTTQELEDHFFGSGAFMWGWFSMKSTFDYEKKEPHFPATVYEVDEDDKVLNSKVFTEETFIEGIKMYAEHLANRTFDDLIEDMDASDVDCCIQFIMFGEIRYS